MKPVRQARHQALACLDVARDRAASGHGGGASPTRGARPDAWRCRQREVTPITPAVQLQDDHRALEALFARLERVLNLSLHETCHTANHQKWSRILAVVVDRLIRRLQQHISFEERQFYAPLRGAGPAAEIQVGILLSEHGDLLASVAQIDRLRRRGISSADWALETYLYHLIELYREHHEREEQWLPPLAELLPDEASSARVADG